MIQGSILIAVDYTIKVYVKCLRPDVFNNMVIDENVVAGTTLLVSWLLVTVFMFIFLEQRKLFKF